MKEEYSWTEKGTLYSKIYDDIFFRDGDGLAESEYVFLDGNNIKNRLSEGDLKIGELGFGTGLNFLLTWREWQECGKPKHNRLTFISCEKHPLNPEILKKSHSFFPEFNDLSAQLIKKWPPVQTGFHLLEFEEGQVSLLLLFGDCFKSLKQFEGKVDAWYLDGFSPAKNEEMWSENVFRQMAWHSHHKTTLATFTAAGFVRRGLESVGFKIERIKGFGFKKHMTVGQYDGHVKDALHVEPWYQSEKDTFNGPVAVVGAGIAGASLAWNLSRAGYEVTLFDAESEAAAKASGNKRGMVYPLISKKIDRLGSFSEIAAHHCWNLVNDLGIDFREGILEFLAENKKSDRFDEALSRYGNDYLDLVERPEISKDFPAVFHKRGLSFAPRELVFKLIEQANVKFESSKKLIELKKTTWGWILNFADGTKQSFTNVFMCNAIDSKSLNQFNFLPLRISRGQVCYLPEKAVKKSVNDLNYIHYLTKAGSEYILGATFDVDDSSADFRKDDSQILIDSVNEKFPGLLEEKLDVNKLKGRVCFRTVTHDYFPIAGQVPDLKYFDKNYSNLKHGKPVSEYPQAQYEKGLFVSAGHGSRGLAFAPLSSAYLTKLLKDEIHILPVQHIQAVHPARFLIKKYKKG